MEIKDVLEVMDKFDQSSISEFVYEKGDFSLTLEKKLPKVSYRENEGDFYEERQTVAPKIPVATPVETVVPKEEETGESVKAPIVGVFYAASAPEAAPFVKVGQTVAKGDTVCILEAMKVLNEIKAPTAGVISEIYVANGDVVEFDQQLMLITEAR